jgi:antitoxin YobK
VKFPISYKLFLKKYGLGDIFGEVSYGLGIEENKYDLDYKTI